MPGSAMSTGEEATMTAATRRILYGAVAGVTGAIAVDATVMAVFPDEPGAWWSRIWQRPDDPVAIAAPDDRATAGERARDIFLIAGAVSSPPLPSVVVCAALRRAPPRWPTQLPAC
jgi:hypothetical protein